METPHDDMEWVWVIVERYQTDEKLYGQTDEEQNISFIPVFQNKDDALMVLGRVEKKKDHYYQIQATRYGEVATPARENGFMIFFLGGGGEIIEKISFSQ